MTPTWKPDAQPTYHRDGSVSYWDVYLQQWARRPAQDISDEVQASQDEVFRRRVRRMAGRYHVRCVCRAQPVGDVTDIDGALAVYAIDDESGQEYMLVYRCGGTGWAELWLNAPDQTDYIWRAVQTPVGLITHVTAAVLARRQVAS